MMWPVFLEYLASVVWAYAMFAVLVLALVRRFLPPEWQYVGFWPEWHGMLLGITCMLQMGVSLWIDQEVEVAALEEDVVRLVLGARDVHARAPHRPGVDRSPRSSATSASNGSMPPTRCARGPTRSSRRFARRGCCSARTSAPN